MKLFLLTLGLLMLVSIAGGHKPEYGYPNPHNEHFSYNAPFVMWNIECDFKHSTQVVTGVGFYRDVSSTLRISDMPSDCMTS